MKRVYVISSIIWGYQEHSQELGYLRNDGQWSSTPIEARHFESEAKAIEELPAVTLDDSVGVPNCYKVDRYFIPQERVKF